MNESNRMNIVDAAKLVDMHVAEERNRLEAAMAAVRFLTPEQLRAIKSQEGIERHLILFRERLCSAVMK